MIRSCPIILTLWLVPALASAQDKPARLSVEGRLIYANDDDWDWASPANAKPPCKLAVYGKMTWSALDWMEEGLTEVRGVLIGDPPLIGDYLTMADLNKVRGAGKDRGYDQLEHRNNILHDVVRDKKPPNVIILMQDRGPASPAISERDQEAALEFVKRGGRLLILDDWQCYRTLMARFVDEKRFGPKKPPMPEDPKRRKEVEARAKLLGSEDFKTRETAFQELVKMGAAIIPHLEKHKAANLEEERRVERLIALLRPPPTPFLGDWFAHTVRLAVEFHPLTEVKGIVRDGPMLPGSALCIRMPVVEKK